MNLLASISLISLADKARTETLVQQCLTSQWQAVAAYEADIGAIVARLYNLTDAEIAIIEGQAGAINHKPSNHRS